MALVIMAEYNLQLFVVVLLRPLVIPPVLKYSYSLLTEDSVGFFCSPHTHTYSVIHVTICPFIPQIFVHERRLGNMSLTPPNIPPLPPFLLYLSFCLSPLAVLLSFSDLYLFVLIPVFPPQQSDTRPVSDL